MLDSNETLSEKFVKKWFWLYLFTFLIGPIGYAIKVMISRDLSVEEVGIIYGVIGFMVLLSSYNDLGCTESLQYFLPKFIVKNDYGRAKYILHIAIKAQLLTSILIFMGVFFFAPWLATHFFKSDIAEILQVAGLFFIGINLIHVMSAIFGSAQDTKLQKGAEFIRLAGTLIGTSILFLSDTGDVFRYILAWLFGLSIGIIFTWYWGIRKYYIPYFWGVATIRDRSILKEFFLYSFSTLFASNVGVLLSQVDMLLIIYFLGMKDTWYYSTYLSLIAIPFIFLTPIIGFLFPVISELSWRKDDTKIHLLVDRFWLYFSITWLWTSLFLFQMWEELSLLFFWEKFLFSGTILQYSAPFIVCNILAQINFQVLSGRGDIRKKIEILLLALILNIILNLLLIPHLGVTGSALAVGISWVPLFLLSMRATKIPIHTWKEKSIYTNLLSMIPTYFIIEKIPLLEIPFFLEFCLALLLYMSIFFATNLSLSREFLMTIRRVRSDPPHIS
jgi:stage V sporulation protein B